ncbi:hypothetical protein QG37_05019 [Candidozyma auris]|uniref:Uncharacterized protein n=1 Tax=Candidozyma auris TaxID=498019 RepID=A0A0L0NVR3_CANAR|nr:hypothetical protein QG37_05019 [[Candida] auris]
MQEYKESSLIHSFESMIPTRQVPQKTKRCAQARNRTGGPTMATLDFTTKPLAQQEMLRDGELNPGLPRDKR